jgi:phenylpropionate dioxygenase-like ring-hydroxylating dioxygenase large terminal subunit
MKPPSRRLELTRSAAARQWGNSCAPHWHPVGLTSDASDVPRKVSILGEDLVLFRDRGGRAGLLHARCCHSGTTLYYGKVEDDGIRCCHHGWKFDTEGHCLEQPYEPNGGAFKDKVRQPWYPVEERYGLIFAFLGPAEKRPVLPLTIAWRAWMTASSSRLTPHRLAAAGRRSSPANGFSISRTWSIPGTCRCCTAPSAARNSPT